MFRHTNRESSFLPFAIIVILFICIAITLSGCKWIAKRQIRKLKRQCDTCAEVVVFVSPGCVPCKEASRKLREAGVRVIYVDIRIETNLAREYGVTKVPAFFLRYPNGYVRVQGVAEILKLCKRPE